jgi:aryl-alcohol dehydrogenase-like predicted oxidoreductase
MHFREADSVRRIALGCAQFGLAYGVANRTGQLTAEVGARVLALAAGAGLDTLDTAVSYGESEARLGLHGVGDWRVVTKLPPLPADVQDVRGWVRWQVAGSLRRLRIRSLHALLLHRSTDLVGPHGAQLLRALVEARDLGHAARIGVSIYAPDELDALDSVFEPGVVQAPFNVLDQRLERSGWLARLAERGVEVHVRSVFLQGVLLQPPAQRAPAFSRWLPVWHRWDGWLELSGSTALAACLGFVLARPAIGRAIVGVDGVDHLRQVIAAAGVPLSAPGDELACDDLELIEPYRWDNR